MSFMSQSLKKRLELHYFSDFLFPPNRYSQQNAGNCKESKKNFVTDEYTRYTVFIFALIK